MKTINWRNVVLCVFVSSFVMAACGDSDDDESGAGGSGGTAGASGKGGTAGGGAGDGAGESGVGGSAGANGGDGGTSRGGGGTGQGAASGDGGAAGDGAGHGGDSGDGGGETGGTSTGGTNAGGMSGAGMGGNITSGGRAGGGMAGAAGSGMAGGGMGGAAGGGMAGGGMAGAAGSAGGGMAGAAVGGFAGMAGAGGGAPENCENSLDDDGDTFVDCVDSDCAFPCALSCPEGTTRAIYRADDLPLAIPDDGGTYTSSALTITNTGMIADIAVEVSVSHPYVSDLALVFDAPRARLYLSTFNGGDGANYTRTIFAQSGSTPIASGTAPFTGVYRPRQPIEWLHGLPLQGRYEFSAGDLEPKDAGSITGFAVATCECRDGCEFGPLACQNAIDDDGDGLADCQDSACASEPACTTPSEWACGDGIDNDGNGQTDCADSECAWLCTTLGPTCTGPDRLFSYGARGLPLTIPTTPALFHQPVFASAPGTVVGTAVRLDVTHGYVADLTFYLTAPSGEVILLSSGNGSSGNNYSATILADSATRGVIGTTGNNTAPFSATYRPESPFSLITGKPAQGLFIADVFDTFTGEGGIANDFTVGLCVTPP